MGISIISGLLAGLLLTYLTVKAWLHANRGEQCRWCKRRGHVAHERHVARCSACGSRWRNGDGGYG